MHPKKSRPWRLFKWPRVGVVDVGSNAIRVTVAELTNSSLREITTERFALRLGKDVFIDNGTLGAHTQASLIEIFSQIKKIFTEEKVDLYRAVATSALRSARNRNRIVTRIQNQTGIVLELIDASEEERIIGHSLPASARKRRTLLMDLGGGSLEIGLYEHGKLRGMTTFPFGAVRMLELVKDRRRGANAVCNRIAERCGNDPFFRALCRQDNEHLNVIGSGGNIRALYRVMKRVYKKPLLASPKLKRAELTQIIQKIERLTPAKRQKDLKLARDRADVILPAAYVFNEILWYLDSPVINIPLGVSLRKGMLLDLQKELFEVS